MFLEKSISITRGINLRLLLLLAKVHTPWSLSYISPKRFLSCANTWAVIVQTDRTIIAARLWVRKREAKTLSTPVSSNVIGISVANIVVYAILCFVGTVSVSVSVRSGACQGDAQDAGNDRLQGNVSRSVKLAEAGDGKE